MDVLCHHIYEYNKGLRNLVLHTAPFADSKNIEKKLRTEGIPYLLCENGNNKINVFFGSRTCIEILKGFDIGSLSELSDEQDFMLGIMLGYARLMQCDRYLRRKRRRGKLGPLAG